MVGEVANPFQQQVGFTLNGLLVDAVDNIAVGTLDPGSGSRRAANMPAILLAAVTHRRGRLRVRPRLPRYAGRQRAGLVSRRLASSPLGAADAADCVRAVEILNSSSTPPPATTLPVTATTNPIEWLRARASELRVAIPQAMRHTCSEMKNVMETPLLPALAYLERTWYEQLALERRHSITSGPYHVTDPMVVSVASAAHTSNDTIMETNSHWR